MGWVGRVTMARCARGPLLKFAVLEKLRPGTPSAAAEAIQQLRTSLSGLGSPRRLRSLPLSQETDQIHRLQALARRMRMPKLVPGMTVHQAKGREWPVTGVRFTKSQIERLAGGLLEENPDDRLLYVDLTRARRAVRLVERAAPPALDWERGPRFQDGPPRCWGP